MRINRLLAAAAASALLSSPVIANPAAPLSLSNAANVKAKTSVKASNQLGGAAFYFGAVAVVLGLWLIIDSDNDDDSDSN